MGMLCTHTLTEEATLLEPSEAIDFLEAQQARQCVPVAGMSVCKADQAGESVLLPAHGAALCMSALDWAEEARELEEACRILGSSCWAIKPAIDKLNSHLAARGLL